MTPIGLTNPLDPRTVIRAANFPEQRELLIHPVIRDEVMAVAAMVGKPDDWRDLARTLSQARVSEQSAGDGRVVSGQLSLNPPDDDISKLVRGMDVEVVEGQQKRRYVVDKNQTRLTIQSSNVIGQDGFLVDGKAVYQLSNNLATLTSFEGEARKEIDGAIKTVAYEFDRSDSGESAEVAFMPGSPQPTPAEVAARESIQVMMGAFPSIRQAFLAEDGKGIDQHSLPNRVYIEDRSFSAIPGFVHTYGVVKNDSESKVDVTAVTASEGPERTFVHENNEYRYQGRVISGTDEYEVSDRDRSGGDSKSAHARRRMRADKVTGLVSYLESFAGPRA